MSTYTADFSPALSLPNNPQSVSTLSAISTDRPSASCAKKIPYQDTVQAHYLDLEAEIELLLQHLQSLSQQQLATASQDKDS